MNTFRQMPILPWDPLDVYSFLIVNKVFDTFQEDLNAVPVDTFTLTHFEIFILFIMQSILSVESQYRYYTAFQLQTALIFLSFFKLVIKSNIKR